MEQKSKVKIPILRSIGNVYEKAGNCNLRNEFFEENAEDLKIVSDFYQISPFQALIVSSVFTLHFREDNISLETLIDHFGCLPTKLLEYTEELDDLDEKDIVNTDSRRFSGLSFTIGYKTLRSVFNSDSAADKSNLMFENAIDIIEEFDKLETLMNEKGIDENELIDRLKILLRRNESFPFIATLLSLNPQGPDIYLFLKLIMTNLFGRDTLELGQAVRRVITDSFERVKYMQTFARNENVLLTNQLVELNSGDFISDTDIQLSEKSIDLLGESGIKIRFEKPKHNNIILPEKISVKKMFFNPRESDELDMLHKSLDEKNLMKLRARLEKKNLPIGVTVLLYGKPGTGKTESVKQMARKTGREIFHVDISSTKSKWYGDSEKQIKKIFTDYTAYASHCPITPILLFNEADAILSKRKDVNSSNMASTENAIQNILLEELENFTGIFIATTNLAGNLDDAFERRFLFKICFDQPQAEVKARIWKSKMPSLTTKDSRYLAENFNFSGGEIDNIIRKCETHYIIYGRKQTLDVIVEFCRSEKLNNQSTSRIGFERNARKVVHE